MNKHIYPLFFTALLQLMLCSCSGPEQHQAETIYEEDKFPQFTTAPIVIEPAPVDTLPEPPQEFKPLQLDILSRRAIARIDEDAMLVPVSDEYVYKALKRRVPVEERLITLSPKQEERLMVENFRLFNRYTVLRSERIPRIQMAVNGIVRQSKLSPGDPALYGCREYVRQYLRLQALRLELYDILHGDVEKTAK